MYQSLVDFIDKLVYVPGGGMVHPGLSENWVLATLFIMLVIAVRSILVTVAFNKAGMLHSTGRLNLSRLPMLGHFFSKLVKTPWVLLGFRLFASALFLLVIYAGLFGTPVAERNIATMLTWTVWWSAVVISVFFVGSAWCAICPWDAIATWLVKRRLSSMLTAERRSASPITIVAK